VRSGRVVVLVEDLYLHGGKDTTRLVSSFARTPYLHFVFLSYEAWRGLGSREGCIHMPGQKTMSWRFI